MAVVVNLKAHVSRVSLTVFIVILICLETVICHDVIPGIDLRKHKVVGKLPPARPSSIPPPEPDSKDYYPMHAGRELFITGNGKSRLHIFCYDGEPKTLVSFFKTIELCLEIDGDNFRHYDGVNSTMVKQEHQEASWLTFYPWRPRSFKLELYKPSCIGIETAKPYKINLRARWVDFWRVVTLMSAVIVFFSAARLASNVIFHYTTGISFGVMCSVLILVYIIARLVPKKSGAVAVMVGGWGLTVYMVQQLWQNFVDVLKEHHAIAIGYVVVAGLISFAAIYRYGPLTDTRSINLVQWGMQLTALLMIFLCSQYREASLGLAIIMISLYSVPDKFKAKFRTLWMRRFPPKIRQLTEEEYIQQASVETKRALEDLREYCRSPKCDKWKVISRLKTPQRYEDYVEDSHSRKRNTFNKAHNTRFAEFVEGGSHLDDDAILAYESNDLRPLQDEEVEDLYMTTDSEEEYIGENGDMT